MDKPSEDEKETVMGILVVAFGVAIVSAFGVAIVSVVFGGLWDFSSDSLEGRSARLVS
jgi:hypothetical protein